jgi:predicted cupin superfamily sugar epimerase
MSTVDPCLSSPILPAFIPDSNATESPAMLRIIDTLGLQKHVEGGYFVETDRDPLRVPNPFLTTQQKDVGDNSSDDQTRAASTTIFYYLTQTTPLGAFHRNKSRTVHTLHKGRGRYVVIYEPDGGRGLGRKARVETFVVGQDIAKGEKLQWIVEGGKYKSSFLLPDEEDGKESAEGLLISEVSAGLSFYSSSLATLFTEKGVLQTVVPGFEFSDHDFMVRDSLEELVTPSQVEELAWMLRK